MSNYILDLAGQSASAAVYTKQGDRCYAIGFEICSGPDPYDLTGCTVLANLEKPDGHTYVGIAEVVDAAEGRVNVNLDFERQMTAAAGEGLLELIIIRGGMSRATASVRFIVQESPGDMLVSGSVIDSITTLAADVAGEVIMAGQSAREAAQALTEAEAAAKNAAESAQEARSIVLGNILDLIYPVGSIVQFEDDSVDPNELYGGTWVRIEGRFLLGADPFHAIGAEGGAETVQLATANLPAHRHLIMNDSSADAVPRNYNTLARYDRSFGARADEYYQLNANSNEPNWGRTSAAGNGTPHENMPPYLAICIWKRTE